MSRHNPRYPSPYSSNNSPNFYHGTAIPNIPDDISGFGVYPKEYQEVSQITFMNPRRQQTATFSHPNVAAPPRSQGHNLDPTSREAYDMRWPVASNPAVVDSRYSTRAPVAHPSPAAAYQTTIPYQVQPLTGSPGSDRSPGEFESPKSSFNSWSNPSDSVSATSASSDLGAQTSAPSFLGAAALSNTYFMQAQLNKQQRMQQGQTPSPQSTGYQNYSPPFAPTKPGGSPTLLQGEYLPQSSYDDIASNSSRGSKRGSTKTKEEKKNHACSQCPRAFARPSALATHMLSHTGEKPHVCPDCQRAFSVLSNLRRHQKVHQDPQPSLPTHRTSQLIEEYYQEELPPMQTASSFATQSPSSASTGSWLLEPRRPSPPEADPTTFNTPQPGQLHHLPSFPHQQHPMDYRQSPNLSQSQSSQFPPSASASVHYRPTSSDYMTTPNANVGAPPFGRPVHYQEYGF